MQSFTVHSTVQMSTTIDRLVWTEQKPCMDGVEESGKERS